MTCHFLARLCFCLLLCCGLLSTSCQAADYITERAYLIDPVGNLSFEQARQLHFTPYQNPLEKGFRKGASWIRLRLAPTPQTGEPLIVRIGLPNYLDEVALFDPDSASTTAGSREIAPQYTGDRHPFDATGYRGINLGFAIPASDQPHEIYLRLKTITVHYLDVEVHTLRETGALDLQQLLVSMLYSCFLMMVLGWAVLIGVQDREPVIGFFIVKQVFSVVYVFLVLGFGRVFFPEWLATGALDTLTDASKIGSVVATSGFELLFLREFRPSCGLWKTSVCALLGGSVASVMLFLYGDVSSALIINLATGLLSCVLFFMLTISARIWREQPDQSAYLLPRRGLILYHAIFLLIGVVAVNPALGFGTVSTTWAIHIFHSHAFVTSVLILGLLYVRHRHREKSRQHALLKLADAEREARDQARRREEQTRFLATTSHELRTPLNGILGMAELALATDIDDVQRIDYVRRIAASGHALVGMISGVLDLGKIESGNLEIEYLDFDLHALLNDMDSGYCSLAQAKNLRFTLWLDPELPRYVHGDPTRIRQILANFVGNAIKFTQKGGVTLSARPGTGGRLRFEVIDTGIGISPEAQQRLFQPYVQAERSTSRYYGGTGLGLSICKKLAELMGGEVGVSSVAGQGSCFRVELELQASSTVPDTIATPTAAPVPVNWAGLRVLVADDTAVNRMIVTRMLQKVHIEVTEVENGEEAVESVRQSLAEQRVYAIVLMDIQMPVMDGLEATRRIRQLPGGEHLPIIALTAGAMDEERDAAVLAGVDDFATKPIGMKPLLERIESTLRRKRRDMA